MRRLRSLTALLAAIALLGGCASAAGKPGAGNSNVIPSEEIAAHSTAANAYELIQRVRPAFLRTRGAVHGTPGRARQLEMVDLVIYFNDARLGGSDELRQIPLSQIREIRYFSAADATTKWGTGHTAGAIQVLSR